MPRQIDLFPQNLQVNNDPTNRMGVTAAQINHLQDQIPAAQAKAQEVAINAMLQALDSVTGLDLVGWWKDTQDLLNLISASQQQSWLNFQNFLNGLTQQTDADVAGALEWIQTQFNQLSASLQQSWLSFQNLINSVVGGVDKDVNDLIVALNSTGADAATATANWDTLFLDLGFSVTTAAQLASWLGGTNTTAVNGSSWSTKITNDLAILLDVFHVTYQAGASGDAPGTLGTNGKPTWYSAWNDILALLGIVNSTSTPSIPAPTIGSAITTAQSTANTAQTTLNTTNTNLFGSTTPGTTITTGAVPTGIPATKIANVLGGSNLGSDVSTLNSSAAAQKNAQATLLHSWQTTLNNAGQSQAAKISAMESAWSTYQAANSSIVAGQATTISQMLSQLFGYDTTTGQLGQSYVAGLQQSQDQFSAAMAGDAAHAGPYAWLAQLVNNYYAMTGQAHSTSIDNKNILAIQNNASSIGGLDDTTEANMPLSGVNLTGTAGTYQSGTVGRIALVRCQKTSNKGAIAFLAAVNSGPVTSLVLHIYKFNKTTGGFTFLQTTSNLSSQLSGTTPVWIRALLPGGAGQIAVSPGDVIGVLPVCESPHSIRVFGQPNSSPGIPNHPTAVQQNAEAFPITFTAGASIASSNVQWSGTFVSYMALEVTNLPADFHPDQSATYTTSGSQTLDSWAKFVDLVGVGQGGGGQGETGGTVGRGGSPGQWNSKTLVVGTDIAAGDTISWTVQPNPSAQGTSDPGSGGAYFGDGQDGASTVFTWTKPGVGTQTLTCQGGLGGGIHNGSNVTTYGQSPGDYTFLGKTYTGGLAALTPEPGNPPGGSGPGGQPFQYGFNGARGQAWTVERYS